MTRIVLFWLAAVSFCGSAFGQVVPTELHRVRISTLLSGLERPWGLALLPDGRMLVTERAGRMRVIERDGKLDSMPVKGLPRVSQEGEGGLMDVVLHPRYAENGWIYWTYAQRDLLMRNGTELARGRLAGRPGAYRMTDVQILFRALPKSRGGNHFGSRVLFDREDRLILTLGDRGERDRAQDLSSYNGKLLRLTDAGQPAPGNPFLGRSTALPAVFSYGHRNVQGAAIDAGGRLWAVEHGPQGGDELNLILAGKNYGWPVVSYGTHYGSSATIGEGTVKAGMEQPRLWWDAANTVAPSSVIVYRGTRFAAWRGDLLITALRGQALLRVRLDGERVIRQEWMLKGFVPRLRQVVETADGTLLLLTDLPGGAILRVDVADGND